ncbi:hypothetical protein AMECASPLE_037798 [Ameca splendens]|uniref:Uncharacterized protein n=1 Tax=Ameca splendens TaxID=208324 RepID=A0ABV0Z5V0_9TELE
MGSRLGYTGPLGRLGTFRPREQSLWEQSGHLQCKGVPNGRRAICPTSVPKWPAGRSGTFRPFGISSLLSLVAVFGSGTFGNTPRKLWNFATRSPKVRDGHTRARAEIPAGCPKHGGLGHPRARGGAGNKKKSEIRRFGSLSPEWGEGQRAGSSLGG